MVDVDCGMECAAGSSPGSQQRVITGGVTCTSSSSSEMAQLDDVCLSPGYFTSHHQLFTHLPA